MNSINIAFSNDLNDQYQARVYPDQNMPVVRQYEHPQDAEPVFLKTQLNP